MESCRPFFVATCRFGRFLASCRLLSSMATCRLWQVFALRSRIPVLHEVFSNIILEPFLAQIRRKISQPPAPLVFYFFITTIMFDIFITALCTMFGSYPTIRCNLALYLSQLSFQPKFAFGYNFHYRSISISLYFLFSVFFREPFCRKYSAICQVQILTAKSYVF